MSERTARSGTLIVMGVAIVAIVAQLVLSFPYANLGGTDWGADLRGYVQASRSWLAGDGFYLPRQLHGPYPIELSDVLYPPTMLYVFIPFLVLPYQLWWVLAVGLLGFVVWSWRPAPWAVASLLVCLAFPNQPVLYFRGAPVIVFAALVAAALRWQWPGALILFKPSILPFALIGIRTRGWWITAGILVALTLPLIPLIPDWLRAVVDGRGPGGWLYSVKDLPLLMVPVIAYLGRTRDPHLTIVRTRHGATQVTAGWPDGTRWSGSGCEVDQVGELGTCGGRTRLSNEVGRKVAPARSSEIDP